MDRNVSSSFPIIKLNDHILLLHSSPPARVPKLQLAVEQSLTGGRWNAIKKKRYPMSKDKEAATEKW